MLSATINVMKTKSLHLPRRNFSVVPTTTKRSRGPSTTFTFGRVSTLCLLIASSQSIRLSSSLPTSSCEPIKLKEEYSNISMLGQDEAIQIDVDLMSKEGGFSIDQLMELAGLSCAVACTEAFPLINNIPKTVMIVCGPGNNGGDGLVAARHLVHFGYFPIVVYPKRKSNNVLFDGLVKQLGTLNVPIVTTILEAKEELIKIVERNQALFQPTLEAELELKQKKLNHEPPQFDFIVDAIFGFSFQGKPKSPFDFILKEIQKSGIKIISVDIPSGWDVEKGDGDEEDGTERGFHPYGLISLTAPKKCASHFKGRHWLGGRFVPPFIIDKYGLNLPRYEGVSQVIELTERPLLISTQEGSLSPPMTSSTGEASFLYEEAKGDYSIVWITAPPNEAKKLAVSIVTKKLAACVNIMPSVTSVYFWEGQAMEDEESLLMVKTRSNLLSQLTQHVQEEHSYIVPETIAVNMVGGNKQYLKWIKENTEVNLTK